LGEIIMNKAFARLRTAALAAVVVLASAAVAHAETVLHRGNAAEPGTLDPHKASGTWENNVLGDLFLGLTTGRPTALSFRAQPKAGR
jgi:oligopeptide transport system substrate-binding protein